MKSSDRLYRWIRRHPALGKYIDDYLVRRGITAGAKAVSIALLWLMLSATALFATDSLAMRLVLAAVAVGVTVHLLLLRTLPKEKKGIPEDA